MTEFKFSSELANGYVCSTTDLRGRIRSALLEVRHLQQTVAALLRNPEVFSDLNQQGKSREVCPDQYDSNGKADRFDPSKLLHQFLVATQKLRSNLMADAWLVSELREGSQKACFRRALFGAIGEYDGSDKETEEFPANISRKELIEYLLEQYASDTSQDIDENALASWINKKCNDIGKPLNDGVALRIAEFALKRMAELGTWGTQITATKLVARPIGSVNERFRGCLNFSKNQPPNDYEIRFFKLSQAYIRGRLVDIAKKIGHLHDRLGQLLDNTNQLHPAPSLRRRQETALHDHYLSELSRWVHRDMVYLAEEIMGESYPYENLPETIQYWEYDYTSRHASIWCDDGLIGTRRYGESVSRSTLDMLQLSNDTEPKHTPKVKHKTVSLVQNSFWVHDHPALATLMGHELAHELIESLHSKILDSRTLGDVESTGHLTDFIRRLSSNLSQRLGNGRHCQPMIRTEICADILAASIFGFSFLYAWFLETMKGGLFEQRNIENEYGELDHEEVISRARAPKNTRWIDMDLYLRGRALTSFLREGATKIDAIEGQLLNCVDTYLDNNLRFRCNGDADKLEYWRDCGDTVSRTLVNSPFFAAAKNYLSNFRFGKGQRPTRWFSRLQRMSSGLGKEIGDKLGKTGPVVSPSDIPWRGDWAFPTEHGTENNSDSPSYLYYTAVEDWVFRTTHPSLYSTLIGKSISEAGLNQKSEKTHNERWQRAFKSVAKRKGQKWLTAQDFLTKLNPPGVEEIFGPTLLNYDIGALYFEDSKEAPNVMLCELRTFMMPASGTVADAEKFAQKVPRVITNDLIFGRYDQLLTWKIEAWKNPTIWEPVSDNYAYFSRRRLLRRVAGADSPFDPNAAIMVGLKARGFRLPFVHWLKTSPKFSEQCSQCFIYLSHGWEDVVIFVAAPAVADTTSSDTKDIFHINDLLTNCPYVSRTETVITQDSIKEIHDHDDRYAVPLTLRVRIESSIAAFESAIASRCEADQKFKRAWQLVSVFQTAGPMDFALGMDENATVSDFFLIRSEVSSLTAVNRVEVSVSHRRSQFGTQLERPMINASDTIQRFIEVVENYFDDEVPTARSLNKVVTQAVSLIGGLRAPPEAKEDIVKAMNGAINECISTFCDGQPRRKEERKLTFKNTADQLVIARGVPSLAIDVHIGTSKSEFFLEELGALSPKIECAEPKDLSSQWRVVPKAKLCYVEIEELCEEIGKLDCVDLSETVQYFLHDQRIFRPVNNDSG